MYDVNLSMIPLRRAKTRKIFRRLLPISKRKRITATRNGHYVGIPDVSISDVCSRPVNSSASQAENACAKEGRKARCQ